MLLTRGAPVCFNRDYSWYIWSGYLYSLFYSYFLISFIEEPSYLVPRIRIKPHTLLALSFCLLCFEFLLFTFILKRLSIVDLISSLSLFGFQYQFFTINHHFSQSFFSFLSFQFSLNKTLFVYEIQNKTPSIFTTLSSFKLVLSFYFYYFYKNKALLFTLSVLLCSLYTFCIWNYSSLVGVLTKITQILLTRGKRCLLFR